MPAYSGLWDGIHGEAYDAMTKADAQPPFQRGIVRVLMQGRGMHGHVNALGRNSPAEIARVDAAMGDLTGVRGTFDYATRTDLNDMQIDNGNNGSVGDETIARPADATEADMAHTYDTTLRNGHPADAAETGATSPEVSEENAVAGP